ncbi:putative CorA-like Mg2+ transporter [Zalerion maritima]|uniref:CorA-like Mg2+ transporter n=1 Tax=Zalerion maritima TaxID=339359 RepID=A0AAD5WTT7_9PEZI|nr:putative CorA-like Mg2+ transporter [Zalerion maritima]
MLLDLKFSVGTLGLAMGTFLAGLYGMNLENFIEETKWGFVGITSMSVFFSLTVCFYGLAKLRRVQRVKMYGDMGAGDGQRMLRGMGMGMGGQGGGGSGHQHWFQDDGPVRLLEARNREKLRRIHQQKERAIVQRQRKWWNITRGGAGAGGR